MYFFAQYSQRIFVDYNSKPGDQPDPKRCWKVQYWCMIICWWYFVSSFAAWRRFVSTGAPLACPRCLGCLSSDRWLLSRCSVTFVFQVLSAISVRCNCVQSNQPGGPYTQKSCLPPRTMPSLPPALTSQSCNTWAFLEIVERLLLLRSLFLLKTWSLADFRSGVLDIVN